MVRSETMAHRPAGEADAGDERAEALRDAVTRVRRELAAHPAELPDRVSAEEELALLDAMAAGGTGEVSRLRGSLLLIAAALGSVSALTGALAELRQAVDAYGAAGPPAAG